MITTPLASRSLARSSPRLLYATLMLGLISQSLAFTAFVAALPQMAADFGSRGEFIAQMMMALTSLGLLFGALASGWILKRAGTRVTLIASALLYGLAGAGGMILKNPSLLLGSRVVMGFASACMVTTCLWGIGAEYQGNRRASALGITSALANAAALVASLLGGFLAEYGGWRLAFIQFPVFAVLAALLAYFSLRQEKPRERGAADGSSAALLRLLPFYLLATLLFVELLVGAAQFPFLLQLDGVHSSSTRSLFQAGITIVSTLVALGYGPLQQRLSASGTLTLGLLAQTAALALCGWGTTLLFPAAAAILLGIYIGTIGPYVYHSVTERTDEGTRGQGVGVLNAFCFLGGFLNPLILGSVSQAIGLHNAFKVLTVFTAVLVIGALARQLRDRASLKSSAAN